jgi:hypothetical protein
MENQTGPLQQAGPPFIEWFAPMSGNVAECSIMVESERGAKMHIELKSIPPQWLSSMLREFVA